jgi:hypothetical protein
MAHDANQLHEQAELCRRLARLQTDRELADRLDAMADEFDRRAEELKSIEPPKQ